MSTKMAAITRWHIVYILQTTERIFTTLDRKQEVNILYQVFFGRSI